MVKENHWVILSADEKRVQNIVLWDGKTKWEPPSGLIVRPYDPDIHPYIGLDVDVGPNWRERLSEINSSG